jgi:hypothetical protein
MGSESQHVIYKDGHSQLTQGFSPSVQSLHRTCPLYQLVLSLVVGFLMVADFPAALPDWLSPSEVSPWSSCSSLDVDLDARPNKWPRDVHLFHNGCSSAFP